MITGPKTTNNTTSSSGVNKYSAESKAAKTTNTSAAIVTAQSETATATTTAANTVSLSKEAKMMQKLAQEISAYPSVDADRVAEIKSEIANGGYNINSSAIAKKMILLDSLYK